MNAIAYSSRLAAFGLVVLAVACGRSPTAPGQPSAPDRVSGQTTFTIINGWSREPVAGATVTANGGEVLTDAVGQVRFPATPSNCLTIEVKMAGFLERRACGSANVRQITLWPVANADESAVTRKWLFNNDQISGDYWSTPTHIALGPELSARAGIAETWSAATDAISEVSQGRIRFEWVTSAPEEGLLIVAAGAPVSCSVVPPWSLEIGGFCVKYDPNVYYLDRLQVSPDRLADRSTAVRALLSAVGIRAHSLTGLMNIIRPESDFSEYERKTLGMLGLRPRTVTWPDYDQIQ